MSYILDALRRADSERERGAIPGLHAQPVPPGSAHFGVRAGAKPWVWIVIGVSLGLLVPLAWHLGEREAPPDAAQSTPPVPIAAAPAPPTVAPPAPAPIAAAEPAAATPPAAAKPLPAAVPTPRRSAPAAAASSARAVAKSEAHASAATAESRVYAPGELPEEIRRQLPALAISGSMYSENPANRMLIVNGQLLHEGDKPAPEVLLERIKLKSAVLKYKGYRYEITY